LAPQQTVTSHALLTLPDTLTDLDLLLPPDPTLLNQTRSQGRDPTLLASNPFDLSIEYARGHDEEDPLSQFADDDALDFALDDARSFTVERGRDAMSVGLDSEFGSVRGLNDDMDAFDKDGGMGMGGFDMDDGLDGLDGGFPDAGGLDFGFDDMHMDNGMQLDEHPHDEHGHEQPAHDGTNSP